MNTTPRQGRKGIIAALIFGGFFGGIEGGSIRCADCDDESARVTWQIREAKGEINGGEVYVSEKVLADYPAVRNLLGAVVEALANLECE